MSYARLRSRCHGQPSKRPKGHKDISPGHRPGNNVNKQANALKGQKNMAQSLCKIYLHIIFHVKTTSPNVETAHLNRLHSYIAKLINTTGCKVLCVGGTENHVHTLLLLSNVENVAHVVEEMKRNSSRWIKRLSHDYNRFGWQGGYAAFSVSQSVVNRTMDYIRNQAAHHRKLSFRDEYLEFLRLYKIEYNEQFVLTD